MNLAEEDDFPTLAADRLVEHGPFAVAQEFPPHPAAAEQAAQGKRGGGSDRVADEVQQKAPPEAEEQSAADGHDAAGEEQDVAGGVEQRVEDGAPEAHAAERFLDAGEVGEDGVMARGPDGKNDRGEETAELEIEGAFDSLHRKGRGDALIGSARTRRARA